MARRAAAADSPPVPTRAENDATTRKGFDHFYNLEYDKAIREFEAAQQAHPNDPFAVNHTLEAVIFKELFRIGALDTEAYAGDSFLDQEIDRAARSQGARSGQAAKRPGPVAVASPARQES